MPFFTKSFLDWFDEDGFWVRDTWDYGKNRMVGPGKLILSPFQRRIFEHILTPNDDDEFRYRTILYSTIKKSGKTTLGAMVGSWFAETAPGGTEIFCLDALTPVYLPGGKRMRIADMVRSQYSGHVLSMNTVTGQIEEKSVIGWHKSNLGSRKMYWLSPDGGWWNGKNKRSGLLVTHDHPIFTPGGWKTADEIRVGDLVATDQRVPNSRQEELIVGTMLGDAHIRLNAGKNVRGTLIVAHGYKQKEWLQIKQSALGDLTNGICSENKGTHSFNWVTFGSTYFKHERERWYSDNKKIVPSEWVEKNLSPLALATWYLDDGSRNKNSATFEVMGFTEEDAKFLSDLLANKYEIKNTLGKFRGKPRIFVSVSGFQQLCKIIGSYVPASMRYKLLDGSPEYDSSLWELGDTLPFFDQITEKEERQHKGKGRVFREISVYCLDVADNHNFIAGGVVVHNCIANDEQQTVDRMMKDIKYHAGRVKEMDEDERDVKIRRINNGEIIYANDTFIQALSQSYRSSAGSRHALTLWDELWGVVTEGSRRMWDEMTPIPTIPYSLRFIATYAGFINESDLLWDLYINGVGESEHPEGRGKPVPELEDITDSAGNPLCFENNGQFTYWNHEPTMPWQTPKYYEQELANNRPAAYLRLHENQWVTTHEAFIPDEWWDFAAKAFPSPAEFVEDHPFRSLPVYIGVDAAVKRDSTAVVGVAFDAAKGKVALMFHRIWTPHKDDPMDLEATVENYILTQSRKYHIAEVAYDPRDLQQTMMRIRKAGIKTTEVTQHNAVMTAATQSLFDLFKWKNLMAYPDEELKTHLQNAVAQEESKGFRIVKQGVSKSSASQRKPIDGAIALAIACHQAVSRGGVEYTPIRLDATFADMSTRKSQTEMQLPYMFRD